MRQARTRFKGELEASGSAATAATNWWSTDTFAALDRSVGRSEERVFVSGILGREKSPSEATLKRVATVLLRWGYGGAPLILA
jgi:hypothetical protein